MTNKKQREELVNALSEWVFEGIAHDWSTSAILLQVHRDWQDIVGDAAGIKGARELSEWQGQVLDLLAVGTGTEIAAKQRQKDAEMLLWATTEIPENSVIGSFVRGLAEDVLRGEAKRRDVGGEIISYVPNIDFTSSDIERMV